MCPGSVRVTLDIRHPQDHKVDEMEAEMRQASDRIALQESEAGCTVDWSTDTTQKAVNFAPACINVIRDAAEETVGKDKVKSIRSGAGHDS